MNQLTWRDHMLMFVTVFTVANVRHLAQYGKLAWSGGIVKLGVSLLVHYIALLLVCAGVLAIMHLVEKGHELDFEKLVRYVYSTALVLALAVL